MSNTIEVALISDSLGTVNTSVYDPRVYTNLKYYKGGNIAANHTLAVIKNDYIIAAEKMKPLLHVWPINSSETLQGVRIVCPGTVNALDVSFDGIYCAAGISEKLHLWHISSGRLMAVITRHFQPITCVKFTDDGSRIITAAQDGGVIIWTFSHLIQQNDDLISQHSAGDADTLFTFSEHTLPVTDLYVGRGGLNTRIVSVSKDRTCKIYDLSTGEVMASVIFPKSLSAVTMDYLEQNIYVGDVEGLIYTIHVNGPPAVMEGGQAANSKFIGHEKEITCLSISLDGTILMSGSKDEKVKFWNIPSRLMMKTLFLKGEITNAIFKTTPTSMFKSNFKSNLTIQNFQKNIESDENVTFVIEIKTTEENMISRKHESTNTSVSFVDDIVNSNNKAKIQYLMNTNRELYLAAVDHTLTKPSLLQNEIDEIEYKRILCTILNGMDQ